VVVEHRTGKPSLADAMKAIEEARAALRNDTIAILTTPVERVESVIEVDGDDDEGGDDRVVESLNQG
jgi:hypothetical protein